MVKNLTGIQARDMACAGPGPGIIRVLGQPNSHNPFFAMVKLC